MIQTTTIDLHSHYLPPDAARRADAGITVERRPDGRYDLVASGDRRALAAALCDPRLQLADLQEKGLARRVLAVPPFCFQYELPADAGARWCRALNEGIAATARAAPDTFVGFATLPLQDVAASLVELERAVHDLGLQGVEIATNIDGVELDGINRNQPGHLAGLQKGDIVIEFNDKLIRTPGDLRLRIYEAVPGSIANVTLIRNGERIVIPVKVGWGRDE